MELHFIHFILGQNFQAFENWKKVLKIITHYQTGFKTKTESMSKFIRSIIIQLVEFPKDMMGLPQQENLLFVYLTKVVNFTRTSIPDKSKRLEKCLFEQCGWEMVKDEVVPDDELPVVVEI